MLSFSWNSNRAASSEAQGAIHLHPHDEHASQGPVVIVRIIACQTPRWCAQPYANILDVDLLGAVHGQIPLRFGDLGCRSRRLLGCLVDIVLSSALYE